MKKFLLIYIVFLSLKASATISLGVTTFNPISSPDNPGGIPVGSIWQLIWSPDNIVSPLDSLAPLSPQDGEILLDQFNGDGQTSSGFTDVGGGTFVWGTTSYDATSAQYGSQPEDTFVGGFAYLRVFDFQGPGTPGNGTYYAESPLFLTTDQDPTPSTPQTVAFAGPLVMTQQIMVVPEPSTFALMAIAGLGLIVTRKLKK